MNVYSAEIKRQIELIKKTGNKKIAREKKKILWRYRLKNMPFRLFKKENQVKNLRTQVALELFWCIRQGQEEALPYLQDMSAAPTVNIEAIEFLDRSNPLHLI